MPSIRQGKTDKCGQERLADTVEFRALQENRCIERTDSKDNPELSREGELKWNAYRVDLNERQSVLLSANEHVAETE